jgi:hypothetical protein
MRERWQWMVMGVVASAHVAVVVWLSHAMVPQLLSTPEETVMIIELIDPTEPDDPPPAIDEPPVEPPPVAPLPPESAPPEPVAGPPDRRQPVPMEAVIEPRLDTPSDPDATRALIAPDRDPFSRPAPSQGFGRRDVPTFPQPNRPRIAGERPPNAPLPEIGMPHRDARAVIDVVGAFIGGGANAPIDAPCGGRVNGSFGTADGFSPNWQRDYGCGDMRERAGFDGTAEVPPGTAGEPER